MTDKEHIEGWHYHCPYCKTSVIAPNKAHQIKHHRRFHMDRTGVEEIIADLENS